MKKFIIIFITIVLMMFFAIFFLVSNNDKYSKNVEKEIKKNYEIKDEIKYLNKSNLCYIIVTTKNLIVLDNEYKEKFKEDISKIKNLNIDGDKKIVYRLNQVMYEKSNVSNDKITYNYYDIYTNKLLDTVEIGG